MRASASLALLLLAGCGGGTFTVAPEPPTLTLTSPTYGAYLGDATLIEVSGVVTPTDAQVIVDGVSVRPEDDGTFRVQVVFPEGDRAAVVDVWALHGDEKVREIVPVFDGQDPRLTDPGALRGLLTPAGLDALEPVVADQIDALGWQDQLLSALPALETEYLSLVPSSIETSGTSVDLAPGETDIATLVTFHDVVLTTDVTVLTDWTFPMAVGLGEIVVGARAAPTLQDDMLALTLADATVSIQDVTFWVADFEIPDWLYDWLMDPILELVSSVTDALGDALLEEAGTFELAGPFAFELPLGDVELAARLVEVGANLDGVGLGATISVDGEASATLPQALPALATTTPSGLPYQLGVTVHEGIFNTLMDETLGVLFDIEAELPDATMGYLLDDTMEGLPGGDQLPEGKEGWCVDIEVEEARVVRMNGGTGAAFAQAWLPDVRVDVEVLRDDGSCTPWLEGRVFAVVDLNLDGSTLSADVAVRQAWVTEYEADANRDETAAALGAAYAEGLGNLTGMLTFDLADVLGGALGDTNVAMDVRVVSVEPLDQDGMFGVYLDVF